MKLKNIKTKYKRLTVAILFIGFLILVGIAIWIFPIERNTIDSASIAYAQSYSKNNKSEEHKTYATLQSYLEENMSGLDDVSDFQSCKSVIITFIPSAFKQKDQFEGLEASEAYKIRDDLKKGADYNNELRKNKELELDIVNEVGFQNVKQFINLHSYKLSLNELLDTQWKTINKRATLDDIKQMNDGESLLMGPFIDIFCIQENINLNKYNGNDYVVGIFQNDAETKISEGYDEIIIKESEIKQDGRGYAYIVAYVKDEETKSLYVTKMELYLNQSNNIFESKWKVAYKNISTLKLNYINGDERELYTILSNI